MGEVAATDYAMSDHEADQLKGIALLPHDIRREALALYASSHGRDALINLFSQFIGMANSVVANSREMAELLLITEGKLHPYEAEKVNTPTIFGALCGVSLANGVNQKKTCGGCAYRLGTMANQSPSTTSDADWCIEDGWHGAQPYDFLCHERLDEKGNPTTVCLGHAQRKKQCSARAA